MSPYEDAHRVDISPYFGNSALFFPLSPTPPENATQWRDPHACLKCGAAVMLPMVHVEFHKAIAHTPQPVAPQANSDLLPALPEIPSKAYGALENRLLADSLLDLTIVDATDITTMVQRVIFAHDGKRISRASLRRELTYFNFSAMKRDKAYEIITYWMTNRSAQGS